MSGLFWITLSLCEKMGNKTIKKLYTYNPAMNYREFCTNPKIKNLVHNKNVYENIIDRDYFYRRIQEAEKLIANHKKHNIDVISIGDILYPELLMKIENPPAVLYAKGNVQLLKKVDCIAVIGTRQPTSRGIIAGRKIARNFAEQGFTIVSGLAIGIDTAGHEGALAAGVATTIAILANSLDDIYPAENKELANKIIEQQGLLLSEIPIGKKVFRSSFVARDRIQSGLSIGICVIQTPLISGTQHTINFAIEQERLVFCPVPTEPKSVEATHGIYQLMENVRVEKINTSEDYLRIRALLLEHKEQLRTKVDENNSFEKNVEYDLFDLPDN